MAYVPSGNLFVVLVYYLEMRDVGLGAVVGNAVHVNCTGDMTCVLLLYLPNICWILLCKKGCNFLLSRTIWRHVFCLSCDRILSSGCIMIDLKSVCPFEDALYTGKLKYSSNFLTEARNIGKRDEDIFLALLLTQLGSLPFTNCQV